MSSNRYKQMWISSFAHSALKAASILASIPSRSPMSSNRGIGFRAFDLLADGKYLDWHDFTALCAEHGVEMVPTVATLPFNLAEIKRYSEGDTLLITDEPHMREGVVVKPTRERVDPKVGRVILTYVSDTYLFGDKTDFTDV